MSVTLQIRRDIAANWTAVNPILHDGEWGYEHDTGKLKIGDGVTAWAALSYFTAAGAALSAKTGTTNIPAAALIPQVVTLTDAATVTPNLAQGNDFRLAMTSAVGATRTIANPVNLTDGEQITITLTQPASGGPCSVTWGSAFDFGSGSAPTLTTTASKGDILGFKVIGTSLWFLGAGPGSGY